jgi:FkbM family methyltransferase
MKTAEVKNISWNMNDDVYEWHRRPGSVEVGNGCIWDWHPVIGAEISSFIYFCIERQPSCFIDIGAHCGVFSSVYCSLVDNHICHSIEPIKEHMERLEDTAKLNDWNLHVHKIGLNDYTGKSYYHNTHMAMFVNDSEYIVPEEMINGNHNNSIVNEILIDTLDNFVYNNNLSPSFIKLDVEGYEVPILKKAQKTLNDYNVDLFIETHRDECTKLGWDVSEICQYLDSNKYVFYTHDFKEEILDLKHFVLNNESNTRFIAINRNNTI